jgi:DNA-directed RNA polymerase
LVYVLGVLHDSAYGNGLARVVGKRAEYVLWLCHSQWGNSKHLEGLKLASGSDLGMDLMTKRLRDQGFKKAASYEPLKPIQRTALGWIFIECIEHGTRLIEGYTGTEPGGRRKKRVRATPLFWEFLDNYKEIVRWLRPVKLPMMVPPKPWKGHHDGGYLTIETQFTPVPYEEFNKVMKQAKPCVMRSVNIAQAQCFFVDVEMHQLLQMIWDSGHSIGKVPSSNRLTAPKDQDYRVRGLGPTAYWKALWKYKSDARQNSTRSQIISALSLTGQFDKTGHLHFVNKQDHRGRIYTYGGQIHPQAGDHFRAMLQMKEMSLMKGNEEAFAWSLGEAYGIERNEKARMDFLHEERGGICAAGSDPLGQLEFIDRAKEPFRFAQLCMDWACFQANPWYRTGTIHWLDQTCSGWGHVACLTGDSELAQYTNVIGTRPADLYTGIGLLVDRYLDSKLLLSDIDERQRQHLEWWAAHPVPRSLHKKIFMPVIYGRSFLALKQTLREYLRDEVEDFLTDEGYRVSDLAQVYASAAHQTLKRSFPQVGNLARWLGKIGAMQMKQNIRPHWFTPNGLMVQSYSNVTVGDYVDLRVANRTIKVQQKDQDKTTFNVERTKRKMVPDYVHSMDAAYLQRFICHWHDTYGHPISTVHDCFGTTLDHVVTLRAELNDQWARFYSVDHLARHKATAEASLMCELPEPPVVGTLDRERLGENPYLFC